MVLTKLFTLCCLTWALFGQESAAENLTKNLDLDSIISNMFGNHGSGYPGNTQSYPTSGQGNPQYHGPSNVNNMNPGNNYQGYPSNAYQGRSPDYQRPGNGFNNMDPRYNYQGRPSSQGGHPQYPDSGNGNMNPGNNYPDRNYPGYYQTRPDQIRPNQINNPQGNIWNNANENPGMNYPAGSQFFPGSSSQGSPQYQRPGGGFSGNPSNGLPDNYRPNPGNWNGGNWNGGNGNSDFNYDPGFYPNSAQRRPGTNWNNLNGYPNNQNPNQINVPGNQIQTQGVGSQGFDQQNPGLIQGQPIQYPQGGHVYRQGLQNGGLFDPSQGSNGLNNQLPNLQNKPNFKPTLNHPDLQNGRLHKNGLNLVTPTDKAAVLGNPAVISSEPSVARSPSQMKQCVQDCPSSTDYSPRCGSDNITYLTRRKFNALGNVVLMSKLNGMEIAPAD